MAVELRDLASLMNQGRFADVEPRACRLTERFPQVGVAWKLYGASRFFQGKDALDALRKASELLPVDADTFHHLGLAWHDRGNFLAAIDCQLRALELQPDWAEAYDALGLALQHAGRIDEAIASHRRALVIRPDLAEACGNLGNALFSLKRTAEAADSYRRMAELLPGSAEAHTGYANALLALRQLADAVAVYRKVIALRPDSTVAFANLGNALRGAGHPREAVDVCRRSIQLDPSHADGYRHLGNALFDLGEFDRAAASYEQALALQPDYAEVHTALAVVLRQMGRADAAEASCRRALDLAPAAPDTLALMGEIEAGHGRFDSAQDHFKQALAIDPNLPEGWAGIARNRTMSPADGPWRSAVEKLLTQPLTTQHKITLHYALGKYFDDVGDFDRAFAQYRMANEQTRHFGIPYDRERRSQRVDDARRVYDTAWLAAASLEGNPSARPVFIVGMPRSGTTLCEQIVAAHPAAGSVGELRYWHSASAEYEKSARNGSATAQLIPRLATAYLQLLDETSSDALRMIDKMPANALNLGLINAAFPKGRIIHVRRHPIDTCLSIYFQAFSNTHAYANDLDDLAHYYAQHVRMMAHWRATLPADALLEIQYEDLVVDPETWGRRMLAHIDLPWDPRCLEFQRSDRPVLTASSWQVRQHITQSSVGRWRQYESHIGPLRQLLELEFNG